MLLELRLKQELKKCPRLGIEPTEFRWGTIYLTLAKSAVALTNTYLQTTLSQKLKIRHKIRRKINLSLILSLFLFLRLAFRNGINF